MLLLYLVFWGIMRIIIKRYYALYAKTARERYVDLIHEYPQIEQEILVLWIGEHVFPYSELHFCEQLGMAI